MDFLGCCRLRGHRDQITEVRFLRTPSPPTDSSTSELSAPAFKTGSPGYLVTTSKDTFLKLWDLTVQHCIETVIAHRSETWSLAVNEVEDMMLTGSADGEMKVWELNKNALAHGLRATDSGEVS